MKNILSDLPADSPALRLLVRVLATTDAAYWPIRAAEWKHPLPAAIVAARHAVRNRGGVLLTAPGTDADRKAAERLTDALIASRYLRTRRRARGRYLRLTDEVEDKLRPLCGLPALWLAFETARRLSAMKWTAEIDLNHGKGWGDNREQGLVFVEHLLLPALVRGVVESASTVHGHVYYRRVAEPPTWPSVETEEIEPNAELARYYHEETKAAREKILSTDVGAMEIGAIPLPVSL